MQNTTKKGVTQTLLISVLLILVHSCAGTFHHPVKPAPARLGEFSNVHRKTLSQLPEPREKIFAAVYSFRDQTGQYKLMENAASWSTVVTQGATSILQQSLEESGWFTTIEREGLSNLLNERRIIRQTQEQFQGSGNLPPLLYAGVIIEGGIVAYETNTRTGGAGARYLGTGASGQYREDQVTVYLRAVSTSTGRILKTVHASKTLLSQKLDMGVFRFVSLKKLLEAETGYTYNEPSFVAVQEAIDKAVTALIIEGIEDNLWGLKDPEDMQSYVIQSYFEERNLAYRTDYLGNITVDKTKDFSVGLEGMGNLYDGDYTNGVIKPAVGFSMGFFNTRRVNILWNSGIMEVGNQQYFKKRTVFTGLNFRYNIFPRYLNTPFISAGYGVNYQSDEWFEAGLNWNETIFQYVQLGAGYSWELRELPLHVNFSVNNQIFLSDKFDGLVHGRYTDRIWTINIGLEYRFNFRNP